jgi:hypothetical protein
MRTYDPADRILYIRVGQHPVAPALPPPVPEECHRLPYGYANASAPAPRDGLTTAAARPALVVLPGGSAPTAGPAPAAPALRLAAGTG